MKLELKDHETIRQYLLGLTSQGDAMRVEEQLLADGDFYEELSIVEDELVEHYLGDNLAQTEREAFEGHFLRAAEHQRKVRFARALHKYVDAEPSVAPTAVSHEDRPIVEARIRRRERFSFLPIPNQVVAYSIAALVLLIVGSIAWIAINQWRQQMPAGPDKVYLATLKPGLTRDGGELTRISMPPGTNTVQLTLLLRSDESQNYRAELLSSEGARVAVVDDLKTQIQGSEKFIILTVPSRTLKRDDYQVRVQGRQPNGTYEETARYQFRVVE